MSKKLVTSYTFDASAKTIDAADFTSLEKIQLITNVTDQIIIYNFADSSKGGTLVGTTLTLEHDTTSMDDTDKLQIFVEDASQTIPVTGTVTANLAAGTNNIGDVDVLTLPTTVHTADFDTGAGTDTKTAFGIAVPASGGAAVIPGDATNGLSVFMTNTSIDIADGGNPILVDANGSDVNTELTTADLDTGAGTDTRAVVGLVGSASGGGALIPGSATDGLLVNLGSNNDVNVVGTKTNNSAAPTTDNVGVLPALVNASSPTFSEGNQSLLSVNTTGNLRATLNQLAGNTVSTGNGSSGTGVLRVAQVDNGTGTIATVGAVTAITNALPAGTNAIGKLAANSGVDIGDVDVTSVPRSLSGPGQPGTAIDSYTHAAFNLAAGADQVLVSSAAGKQIWVYGIGFTVNVAGTVSFQDEDNTAITGVMQMGATGGMTVAPSGNFSMPIWKLGTDKDLEVDVVTSELDGWICYAIVSV